MEGGREGGREERHSNRGKLLLALCTGSLSRSTCSTLSFQKKLCIRVGEREGKEPMSRRWRKERGQHISVTSPHSNDHMQPTRTDTTYYPLQVSAIDEGIVDCLYSFRCILLSIVCHVCTYTWTLCRREGGRDGGREGEREEGGRGGRREGST